MGVTKRFRRTICLVIILLLCLTINCFGIGADSKKNDDRIRFDKITVDDIKNVSIDFKRSNTIVKFRLTGLEKNMLARVLQESNYVNNYLGFDQNNRIESPYLEVSLKNDKKMKLFCLSQGFVINISKKSYYAMNTKYMTLFGHIYDEFTSKKLKERPLNSKYIPELFKCTDFVNLIKQQKYEFTIDEPNYGDSSLLSVAPYVLKIKNEEISIYEYKDDIDMEFDAFTISSDGCNINGVIFDMVKPIHIFKRGSLIMIYHGSNKDILKLLTITLGKQYAGDVDSTIHFKN